jgi:hypothetical protein
MKKLATALITAVLLCGFFFATLAVYGENSANLIESDTTWTAANSPYTLTSPVTVAEGVTLTIQPGVAVDIEQGAILQVDGTLVARGTNTENINMSGRGDLILTSNSPGWNQQTSSGSIIEDANLNLYSITICDSAKIDNNTVTGGIYPDGGSPQITNNNLLGQIWGNGSLQSPLISDNTVVGCIYVPGGSPVILQNTVTGVNPAMTNGSSYTPSSLCSAIMLGPACAGTRLDGVIADNTVKCGLDGISAGGSDETNVLIENNMIENCARDGMMIGPTADIENNTLVNNTIGIIFSNFNYMEPLASSPTPPTIIYNNIFDSSQYNIYSYCNMNFSATFNWWGTTDLQAVSQTIYDHAFDSSLGTINCNPCLTSPNPQAYPNSNGVITYPTATEPPTQTSGSGNSTQPTKTTSTTYFSIDSNSTVSNLFFNSTDSELGFTVSGPPGTTGFAKVTIAKTLMPSGNLQVYMDGNPISSSEDSNGSYWILTFTYHHSTHQVTIKSVTQTGNAAISILNGRTQIIILAITVTALAVFGFLIVYSLRYKNAKQTT